MSDAEIRELERLAAHDPTQRPRLERARLRAGLGWHGERRPVGVDLVVRTTERGVYDYHQHAGETPIQLVYVSGGEVPCVECRHPRCDGENCRGGGGTPVAPFYAGRFPVSWIEWLPFEQPAWLKSVNEHKPVVNVTPDEARAFCAWAGLRLPTLAEWRWACLGSGAAPFPWGDAPPDASRTAACDPRFNGSSSVTRARLPVGGRVMQGSLVGLNDQHEVVPFDGAGSPIGVVTERVQDGSNDAIVAFNSTNNGSSAPVLVEGDEYVGGQNYINACAELGRRPKRRLVPARPAGASWCGAHDMVGNVAQIVSDAHACGGSFRSSFLDGGRVRGPLRDVPSDEVGFRVSLSAT